VRRDVGSLLALQRSAGNAAVARLMAARPSRPTLSRHLDDPAQIRAKWQELIGLFSDPTDNKLAGQNIDLDALRDHTIAAEWFNETDWGPMIMGVVQQLKAKADEGVHVPNDAFMNVMFKQIDTKFRPKVSDTDKQLRKQKVKKGKDVKRTRKDALKQVLADAGQLANLDFDALTDQELVYVIKRLDKQAVATNRATWAAATGAAGNAGEVHVPIMCFWLWNAVGGAGRVTADLAAANTIYNRKGIHIDPVFIRQLQKADVEAALEHRLQDSFYLDFRGVDGDAGGHQHNHKPKFTDADTRKIVARYIPSSAIGALWVGDMIADAGRSPGKSNDAAQKWVVVNTAPTINPIIFAHELGHIAFASSHPGVGDIDQAGHAFTDTAPTATATNDEKSLHLQHNVLTAGGLMDRFYPFDAPAPADVFVSPGQAAAATASPLTYVNP
jgi:hypothetical protein